MTKLTYKEAAEKLHIPYAAFQRFVCRFEFAKYRTSVEVVLYRRRNGILTKYIRHINGINYTFEFVKDFNRFLKQKGFKK